MLREEGIVYKVYKNTMVKLAIDGTEFDSLNENLDKLNKEFL